MKENGIKAKTAKKFKITTRSNPVHPVCENILNRDFTAKNPNQKWVSDITYVWTEEGWLYLSVVLDLFNRMVIGWSMKPRMSSELVCDALRMAIATRLPFVNLLSHSDRGSQYTGNKHRQILKAFGISCSMSRKGNCWDNAVIESFFSTFKKELVYLNNFKSREQARNEIFNYIETFYNTKRIHSSLGEFGNLSPLELEQEYLQQLKLMA